jgi:hypothetical protein
MVGVVKRFLTKVKYNSECSNTSPSISIKRAINASLSLSLLVLSSFLPSISATCYRYAFVKCILKSREFLALGPNWWKFLALNRAFSASYSSGVYF